MSTRSGLTRESFQQLLANAFAVQESGLDTHALSALLEVQRVIATGEPDLDRAMYLIADRARSVANASGVAIARLQTDQLVYQAGSGKAAALVGRHVTAILEVSETRGEILRVENAQTDSRIEADICRQFEAQSLLMLPIFHERTMAGVLQVLFDEPHTFEEREVRTYRLMTRLVEEAILRSQFEQQKAVAKQTTSVPHAIEQITAQMQAFETEDELLQEPTFEPWVSEVWNPAAGAWARVARFFDMAKAPTGTILPHIQQVVRRRQRWGVAAVAVAAGLVVVASLIAYSRRPASLTGVASPEKSNAAREMPVVPAKQQITEFRAPIAAGGSEAAKASNSTFRRIRVGADEIDYISDDVTVRHFVTKHATARGQSGYKQVNFGNDVTVRYFAAKSSVGTSSPLVVPTLSVSK